MTLRYVRQIDNTFVREGEVHSDKIQLRILRNGDWRDNGIASSRADMIKTIEAEIAEGANNLPGDIYELVDVDSESEPMPEEVKKVLRKRAEQKKKDRPLITCSTDGCTNQFPRSKGRYPKRWCEECIRDME